MTLQQAQQLVDEWINTTGVRYFNELTNMAMLTEEWAKWLVSLPGVTESKVKRQRPRKVLADELADVLFVLICLANQTGIDLEEALRRNL